MRGESIIQRPFFWFAALAGTTLVFSAVAEEAPKAGGTKPKSEEKAVVKANKGEPVIGKDGKPVAQTPASPADGLAAFCRLLPMGEKNKNVIIPSFTNGIRTSLINSRTMTRIDDDHMDMEGMDLLLKGETDGQDLSVKMRTATYDLPSAVLSSEERSRVSRNDFQLEGDSLVFDTRTQQGKMVGHVEMIIFDSDMMKGKQKEEPKPEKSNTEPDKSEKTEKAPKPNAEGAGAEANKKETK